MGLTVCSCGRCFGGLVGDADEFFDLVAHFALENLDLFEHGAAFDHRVDKVAQGGTPGVALAYVEGLRGRRALSERVPENTSCGDEHKGLKIREQQRVLEREERDAVGGIECLRAADRLVGYCSSFTVTCANRLTFALWTEGQHRRRRSCPSSS